MLGQTRAHLSKRETKPLVARDRPNIVQVSRSPRFGDVDHIVNCSVPLS